MTQQRIAVLGTGAMGSRLALRLLAAGYRVTVFNRTPAHAQAVIEAGAQFADTPAQAVVYADCVISMLTDDVAARAVWLHPEHGALAYIGTDTVIVECSTVTPTWIAELAEHCAQRGVSLLDAPVLGSRPQAEAGALITLVGGHASVLERVFPILQAFSSNVHYVGAQGAGARLKLAVNTLLSVQVAALAETLAWLTRSGMDTAPIVTLLNILPTTSPALQGIGKLMAAGHFAPLFPIALVEKDLRYTLQTALHAGAAVPLTTLTQQLYANAMREGLAEQNIVAILQTYQHDAPTL